MDKTNIRPQFAAALGAELARLQRRVDGFGQRLDSLAARPQTDGADTGLGARVDDLARALDQRSRESAETRQGLETLRGELGVLGTALSTLRQELAGLVAPLESGIAELAARMPVAPAATSDELGRGLEQVRREVHAFTDRVMRLEGRLASAEMLLGSAAADDRHQRLAADQEVIQRRITDLGNAVEMARAEALEQAEAGRRALEARQDRLRARAGVGLTLVALVGLSLLGALGWWTQSELRRADGRLALLEAETAAGDLSQSPVPVSAPSAEIADLQARYAELRERLDRLTAGPGDAGAAELEAAVGEIQAQLQQHTAAAAALAERIDSLDRRQAETSDRLAALAALVEPPPAHPATPDASVAAAAPAALEAPPSAQSERAPETQIERPPEGVNAEPSPGAAGPRVLAEERYVVQLIGFRSERSVAPFAQRQGIAGEARYRRTSLRGQPWFELVLGDHASEAEAQAALTGLPESLRALGPVVRRLPAGTELLPID